MSRLDRAFICSEFTSYTSNYDLLDPKIKLKYDHTFRVAAIAERIAVSLELSAEDTDLAWLLGMFHDIGRFEQVRRYHTFQDKFSVNHAALSADLLFQENLVDRFLNTEDNKYVLSECQLLETAIRLHNVYRLPDILTDRERTFSTILRDADKIDILRVNCETPREEIYNLPAEAFQNAPITEEVYQNLLHHEEVDRQFSTTGVDFILGHIGFVFGLVYEESLRIVKEQGYLMQLLDFRSSNPDTAEKLQNIRQLILEQLP